MTLGQHRFAHQTNVGQTANFGQSRKLDISSHWPSIRNLPSTLQILADVGPTSVDYLGRNSNLEQGAVSRHNFAFVQPAIKRFSVSPGGSERVFPVTVDVIWWMWEEIHWWRPTQLWDVIMMGNQLQCGVITDAARLLVRNKNITQYSAHVHILELSVLGLHVTLYQ